jgi:DNA-binding MarR family transcriptional regulator
MQVVFNRREEEALFLLYEKGMLGPSELAGPLGVSKPTATRLLQKLERLGMAESTSIKKRILSNAGVAYVQRMLEQK